MRAFLTIALCLSLTACNATQRSKPTEENPTLTGVLWELSKIQSMDDSVYVPRAPGLYTLVFHKDGSVTVRADCNQGRGNWASETASQLSITQLATTRAMCLPRSLHDRFISDLNYTRSFILDEGKLYLATMADGAILEFFPGRPIKAE